MDLITCEVTDLKQWSYCPRIVFYRYCWPDIRPVTSLMQQGIASHHDEATREERRSLRMYGLAAGERFFDLELASAQIGLRGRLDLAIAVPDRASAGAEAVVIEYKDSEQPDQAHFKRQLAAYALLLEAAWGLPVRRGYLYSIPLREATPVPITPALRSATTGAISAMHASIDTERMPDPPASRRPCIGCEFRRFCNDVV